MHIPQIQIDQQYARIKMESSLPVMEIKQKQAQLNIKQPRGRLEIRQRDVKVEIDGYPHRHDLGYKNMSDFRKETAAITDEAVREAISRHVRQGERLMRIEEKGDALLENIREDFAPRKREIGLKWVRGPDFNVVPADLKIDYISRKPEINVRLNKPTFKLRRGHLSIEIAQYGSININWRGGVLDQKA